MLFIIIKERKRIGVIVSDAVFSYTCTYVFV